MLLLSGKRNPPGLIAHWRLNEGAGIIAPDSVGGRDLTLTSGPTWGTKGIVFDGSDDTLNRASVNLGFNGATEFSISFYLKSSDTDGKIFQKQLNTFDATIDARISASNTLIFFMHSGVNTEPSWQYPVTLDGSAFKLCTFCWKRNAGDVTDAVFYVDRSVVSISGFFSNSYSTSFTMEETSANIWVASKNALVNFMSGEVADLRIYNKQLSSTEVSLLP